MSTTWIGMVWYMFDRTFEITSARLWIGVIWRKKYKVLIWVRFVEREILKYVSSVFQCNVQFSTHSLFNSCFILWEWERECERENEREWERLWMNKWINEWVVNQNFYNDMQSQSPQTNASSTSQTNSLSEKQTQKVESNPQSNKHSSLNPSETKPLISINDLPPEMLRTILSHVRDLRSLGTLCRTCKAWNKYISLDQFFGDFWRTMFYSYFAEIQVGLKNPSVIPLSFSFSFILLKHTH
jgi:hypothetical protein